MKRTNTLICGATFLVCGLASAGAFAQGLSVNAGGVSAGGVSVSTGGSSATATPATGGLTTTLKSTTSDGMSEQEAALAAVKSEHALSLDKILAAARQYTDGDIIDAQLITARGFLLYDLKVLDSRGDVSDLYFYAVSGRIVETK